MVDSPSDSTDDLDDDVFSNKSISPVYTPGTPKSTTNHRLVKVSLVCWFAFSWLTIQQLNYYFYFSFEKVILKIILIEKSQSFFI